MSYFIPFKNTVTHYKRSPKYNGKWLNITEQNKLSIVLRKNLGFPSPLSKQDKKGKGPKRKQAPPHAKTLRSR